MSEREIFLAVLDKDDPTERAAYLDEACGADSPLRQRVEALLRSHERAANFMDVPVVEQLAGDGGGLDFLAPSQKPGALGRLGHYEVLEVVGRGGMGTVFRAFDDKLHRVVAIKALAPQLATSSAARQRFVREARAAAAVTHDNVIDIHAVEDEGPVPYLVMTFVDGPTLQAKIDRSGPLPVTQVLRFGVQMAEGLAAAHKRGLIHRDVKPANVLLENGVERVKITDFGLARAADDASLTQSGVVAGTPMYMSPEQARGEPVDHRSDLFSLGSVLYALCAGHPPFRAGSALAVLKRVCEETPRPLREVNPDVPDWLEALIARLHAKHRDERFQSAAEVAERLNEHLANTPQPQAGPPHTQPLPPARKSVRGNGRRPIFPMRGVLAVLAVLLAGGLAGFLWWHSRTIPVPDPTPIRVGVLHSLSGTMGPSESSSVDATLLAIEEINEGGGLLGRPIEPVVVDGMSDWPTYAVEAERLVTQEKVCTIFGCWTSASRKAVVPVVEKHDHLLIYPMQYEGLEQSPNVLYLGAVPNQQVAPAVRWGLDHLGKRFFIVGSDYLWPRATSEVIREAVAQGKGEIVGEEYLPLGSLAVDVVVARILEQKPAVLLEMLAGDTKVAYYRALRQAGVTSDATPSVSFSSTQPGLALSDVAGDYAAWNYFESIDSPANRRFLGRVRAKFGPQRKASDPEEASYVGVHLWAQAVRAAGSADPAAVRRALGGQRFQAPQGEVLIDPQTLHSWKTARIARINAKGMPEIVWSSGEPIAAVPFPASRPRAEWERYVKQLFLSWGEKWENASRRVSTAWERHVAMLPASEQVTAVAARLKEVNPGFDGKVTHQIDGGVVTELKFSSDHMTNIAPVRALSQLTVLDCCGTDRKKGQLADLSPLKGMSLKTLLCNSTSVSDLSPLKGMPLTYIQCSSSQVSDLSPLQGMPLRRLQAEDLTLSDLSPLRGMRLTHLGLYRTNRVTDLTPLKGMPLVYLNLAYLPVSDLSLLKDMTTLTTLVLDEMPVSDLSALKGLPLVSLRIHHTKVSDLAPLKGMPLREVGLDFRAERDTEVLRSLTGLEQINGMPAPEFWNAQKK